MRGVKQITIFLVALTMALSLVGCGSAEDDQYHYNYGNLQNAPMMAQVEKMIDTCGLTPSDVLMIDLRGDRAAAALKGLTCERIRGWLNWFRQTCPPEPQSLLDNPAKTSNPPSLVGVKYAAISSSNSNGAGGYGVPSQVLVDFGNGVVSFARFKYMLAHPDSGTSLPLSSSALSVFLQSLSVVSTWGEPWSELAGDKYELYQWQVAIVTSDDQLYRWEVLRWDQFSGPSVTPDPSVKWPVGLEQVYDAFWALTES